MLSKHKNIKNQNNNEMLKFILHSKTFYDLQSSNEITERLTFQIGGLIMRPRSFAIINSTHESQIIFKTLDCDI